MIAIFGFNRITLELSLFSEKLKGISCLYRLYSTFLIKFVFLRARDGLNADCIAILLYEAIRILM